MEISTAAAPSPTTPPLPAPAAELPTADRHGVRKARFDEVMALHGQGWPMKRIARTLGVNRKTARAWVRAGELPVWSQRDRGSAVDRHAVYLRQRWGEGCHNAVRLWQEIQERGFRGQLRTVQRWIRRLRDASPTSVGAVGLMGPWKMPSKRRAAWLVVADPETIDATEQRFVDALLASSEGLTTVTELARAFSTMVRRQQADRLDGWLAAARETALARFADGLVRDLAAIPTALSLPWSTGPVEGQISRMNGSAPVIPLHQKSGRTSFSCRLTEVMLQRLLTHGLVRPGGRQRTDSTHMLASLRTLNRLENLGETLRAALNAVAEVTPTWLAALVAPEWYERYAKRVEQYRLPRGEAARRDLAVLIGRDVHRLLATVWADDAPAGLNRLPADDVLRQTWIRHFYLDAEGGTLRDCADLPPSPAGSTAPTTRRPASATKAASPGAATKPNSPKPATTTCPMSLFTS